VEEINRPSCARRRHPLSRGGSDTTRGLRAEGAVDGSGMRRMLFSVPDRNGLAGPRGEPSGRGDGSPGVLSTHCSFVLHTATGQGSIDTILTRCPTPTTTSLPGPRNRHSCHRADSRMSEGATTLIRGVARSERIVRFSSTHGQLDAKLGAHPPWHWRAIRGVIRLMASGNRGEPALPVAPTRSARADRIRAIPLDPKARFERR